MTLAEFQEILVYTITSASFLGIIIGTMIVFFGKSK